MMRGLELLVRTIARHFNVDEEIIMSMGPIKKNHISRIVAMYILHVINEVSYFKVSILLDCQLSNIQGGIKKVIKLLKEDEELKTKVEKIIEETEGIVLVAK